MVFILTNDDILFQLINKHTFILTIKGIKSECISEGSLFKYICDEDIDIPISLYPLVLSIAGNKKYGFSNIQGHAINRSIKLVSSLIEDNICDKINNINLPIKIDALDNKNKFHRIILNNIDLLTDNYEYVTMIKTYYRVINIIDADLVTTPTKSTLNYFLELNAKIFNTFPINLDMLLKGERL